MSSHLWDYAKEGEDDDRQRASSVCDDTNDSTRFENLSHKLQRYYSYYYYNFLRSFFITITATNEMLNISHSYKYNTSRSFQEKNMMLGEIQSLKKQVHCCFMIMEIVVKVEPLSIQLGRFYSVYHFIIELNSSLTFIMTVARCVQFQCRY